jgi:Adenylate and Guanylate cyclase catalytic domain
MGETRKLAAILVADVVGYSRLAAADEDRTLARLRGLRSDLIDPAVAAHHGRIVKRTGDGSSPSSAASSTQCAARSKSRVEFRVGIHLGDVVEEADGDLMGDGVNIAARWEGMAKQGAICLSEDAYRQVKGQLDLAVRDAAPKLTKALSSVPACGWPPLASGANLTFESALHLGRRPDESGWPSAAIRTVRRWVVLPIADLAWPFHDVMCLTLWRCV